MGEAKMATAAQEKTTTPSVTPLTGSIGARVDGLDLTREHPAEVADQILQAFARHFVLVFRSEHEATSDEQHRLATLFGEPQPLFVFNDPATPEIYTLSLHDALPISVWLAIRDAI